MSKAATIYNNARDIALAEALEIESIANMGRRDGRSQARRLVREAAGTVDPAIALADVKARFAHLFGEDSTESAETPVAGVSSIQL